MNIIDYTKNLGIIEALDKGDREALFEIADHCSAKFHESVDENAALLQSFTAAGQLQQAEHYLIAMRESLGDDHMAVRLATIAYNDLQGAASQLLMYRCASRLQEMGVLPKSDWLPGQPLAVEPDDDDDDDDDDDGSDVNDRAEWLD